MEEVTIIVPIYNVEKYISKCLNSLVNQTYHNIKILAVDDGSPDDSKKIVEKYIKNDSRIKLIEKKNGGYGSALEMGIAKTYSNYFMICDPDDWLDKNAVKILVSVAKKDNLDIVIGDKFNVYEGENKKEYSDTFKKGINIIPNYVYTDFGSIQKFSLGLPSPHAKLFKTKIARNIKLPHHVSYTDFVLYMLLLTNTRRIEYIKKPLAYYLINRKGNTATSVRPSIINDYLICWESIYSQLPADVNKGMFMYRLLSQLKFIISEDLRVNNKIMYSDKIFNCLNKLMKYKKEILLVNSNNGNIKSKFINKLLLNHYCNKLAIKILIFKDNLNK